MIHREPTRTRYRGRIPIDELRDGLARAEREGRIVPDTLAARAVPIAGWHSYQRITERTAVVARVTLDAGGKVTEAGRRLGLSPSRVSDHCWRIVIQHRRGWRHAR